MICSNCGADVMPGKFCEKCGRPLVFKDSVSSRDTSNMPNNQSLGTGFFDKISSSMNKAASDLMAIRSDFSNGILVYKVSKIPNVQEKKIKIDDTEVLFYNDGTGFTKYNQTFTTQDKDFLCFYIKNVTVLHNSFIVDIKAPIKNLNDTDLISEKVHFNIELQADDIDLLFNSLMSVKQDTWRMIDVNSMLSTQLNKLISENVTDSIKKDGNIDLRDIKSQISKFTNNIKDLIDNELLKYGLRVKIFTLYDAEVNTQEINKILIDNLYKGFEG